MSYIGALNLRNAVTRSRTTQTADGKGGYTTTTSSVTIPYAAIWQAGASKGLISEQLMAVSTHVLVCLPSDDIVFSDEIVHSGVTYQIMGHPDNVMFKDEILVVPLQRIN